MIVLEIIPAILVHSEEEFKAQANAVSGVVSFVQIDIGDGLFVPNTTWAEPERVAEILDIDCELHLMVQDPLTEARKWEHVPQVKRVLIHYESQRDQTADIVTHIQSYNWEVGVVLNIETPITVLNDLMEELDVVQFMGITPGFTGQPFQPEVLQKITQFHAAYPHMPIAIDGHANETTIPDLLRAGVSRFGMGSAIFGNSRSPAENVEQVREIIKRLTE